MTYFEKRLTKLRYSHPLRLFFDVIAKLGIRISPFILFKEIISPENSTDPPSGFEDYGISFWGPVEMKKMALIPGRPFSEEFLLKRLNDGQLCLGLKKENELIAFTWCNLDEITVRWNRVQLKKDETYIFDVYTLMAYRGKGLALYLRYHLYQELQKLGRSKIYSYSDYFDKSAVRFKLKLSAQKSELILTLALFGKWYFYFVIKDYKRHINSK